MPRRLPSPAEAADILSRKRTRPPLRPPPPAGKSLAPYLKEIDARFGGVSAGPRALRERWREIVGETLSRRSEASRLIRGRKGEGSTLEVRVDGPAAALVQHQASDILARVNLLLGPGAVERLRVVQGPVRAAPAAAQPRARKLPPLDAAQEAALAEPMASAPDGGLKRALLRLGREVVRRG
jgi:hypothetical protein